MNAFLRTELLLGATGIEKLKEANVAVFGIGGVGGFVTEALARSGVGALTLVDNDTVSETNLNRQIIALRSTIGKYKTQVMKERIQDINPDCKVEALNLFYTPETAGELDFSNFDYIVDAIDTLSGKLTIIENAKKANVPVISSMGAGNKLDPTAFEVADISKTSVCPLARAMRRELKKRGIEKLKVVYSKEQPITVGSTGEALPEGKKSIPGSVAFVPSVVGLIIAAEVIKDLVK
ncbi:MAG: tRNA threonylcarbamoyladenosine dehydratase [Clostridia bacterium]|nr:tRNA threonylcarbamoyladenosine dehydratase [Clostridia bacterium]